jgi:hypothetical protein
LAETPYSRAVKYYPGNYGEFLVWFPDNACFLDYSDWLRWPNRFWYLRCVLKRGGV